MTVYISCYYADSKPILGNGDGQAVIHAKNYKRTNAYKRIVSIVGKYNPTMPISLNNKVAYACVESYNGDITETIGGKQCK
jgi:hypothetical protein